MKNLGQMMKQVQQMQARMSDMQARLETLAITGQASGGAVTVTLDGKGNMKAITIDPSLLKADDKDILEDVIVAAHADAKARVEAEVAQQMKDVTGGLPLPPGFQLPI